jgi:PadR family transcriptional regulator, regulatory protein PadR
MAAEFGRFPGVPELLVLQLLSEREMYGYEIVQAIALRTAQVLEPGEGLIYPLLKGLEIEGALKSRSKAVNGRSRVYYSLTGKGEKRLGALAVHWSKLNGAVQAVLTGGSYAV